MLDLVGTAAAAAVKAHVVASALNNTPDTYNQDLAPFVAGWPVPGWRFFAPNPGTQNVHLLVRTARGDNPGAASTWRDVTPPVSHGVLNVIWNPRSRGPKALFDFMQQLTVMNANYATFEWITSSLAYELVSDASRGFIGDTTDEQFQFLLMNYVPSAPEKERMRPFMVSEWMPISPTAVSK